MIGSLARRVRSAGAVLAGRVDAVLVCLLALVAVAPFGRLFADGRYLALATGATAVALACSLGLRRRSAAASALAGWAVLAAYLLLAVFAVGVPTIAEVRDAWSDSVGSWAAMLTAGLPAAHDPGLVVLPVLLAWAAAFAGVQLALRRRSSGLPAVPALAVFGLALAYAGKRHTGSLLVPLLAGLLVLAIVLVRANRPAGEEAVIAIHGAGHRRAVWSGVLGLGLPLAAAICLVSVAAAPALPLTSKDDRVDLREKYAPPLNMNEDVSPLSRLPGELRQGGRELFKVTFSDVPRDMTLDRVRLATLDSYDGTVWASTATFPRVGRELTAGPADPRRTAVVRQSYVLEDWKSAFLPALDRPTRIVVPAGRMGADARSGMLVVEGQPRNGTTYDIESVVPVDPRRFDRKAVMAGSHGEVAPLANPSAAVPWPSDLLNDADSLVPRSADRFGMLEGLERRFTDSKDFGFSVDAPAGHSMKAITSFLAPPQDGGSGRVGSPEQYAAAFAVLARIRQMPSRVVIGYKVDPIQARSGKPVTVFAKDIWAWAEVHLNGIGWVPFDPTTANQEKPVPPTESTQAQVPTSPATTVPPGTQTPTSDPPVSAPRPQAHQAERSLWPLAAVGALLLGVPASIVLAKRLRRRRRRRGTPAEQVVGAWLEARDRLLLHGVPVRSSWTVAEQARRSTGAGGAGPAAQVWAFERLVDVALYAPEPPEQSVADAAWGAEADLRAALRAGAGVVPRLWAVLSPRPLLRREPRVTVGAGGRR